MFDPYHKWLGIPVSEQPPNHYRLLGVELFEADRDVIDAAADRHLTYLKAVASGKHTELAEQIANEVAAARLLLVDPSRRSKYDLKLKLSRLVKASTEPESSESLESSGSLKAAERSVAQPSHGSTEPKWFVMHHDGITHGPFTWKELLQAASAGNIVADTRLRHATVTADQWVVSTAIEPIARRIKSRQRAEPSESVETIHIRQGPKTKTSYARFKSVVRSGLILLAPFFVTGFLASRNPSVMEVVQKSISGQTREVVRTEVGREFESHDVQADRPTYPEPTLIPESLNAKPKPDPGFWDSAADPVPDAASDQSDQATDTPIAFQSISVDFDLDLASATQRFEFPEFDPAHDWFVDSLPGSPVQTQYLPSSRKLAFDEALRIEFAELSGLAVELSFDQPKESPTVALVAKWTFAIPSGRAASFSLDRIQNRSKYIVTPVATAQAALTAARFEKSELVLYVKSKGVKPLDSVNAAKNRIMVLNRQIPMIEQAIAERQRRLREFDAFHTSIMQIHENCKLSIRSGPPQ